MYSKSKEVYVLVQCSNRDRPMTAYHYLVNLLYIISGMFIAVFGINGFLIPNAFIDGGVTGLSMLISDWVNIHLSWIILMFNIPFVILGVKQMGWGFAFRSSLAIFGLACLLYVVSFPVVTRDPLLCAVFGGLILGGGIGFAFRGGVVLDGTEIFAIILSRRFGLNIGDILLIFNACIFFVASLLLGVEPAMYSVLTYLSASKAIDFLVYGFDSMGVNIVIKDSGMLKQLITSELGLGVTVLSGYGGHSDHQQDILYTVCSRFDVQKIKTLVKSMDDSAFISVQKVTDTHGGVIKKYKVLGHGAS